MIQNSKWYSYEIMISGSDDTMEIDYEKLASAIAKGLVEAQKPVEEPVKIAPKKFTFRLVLKTIWKIMRGEVDTEGEMTIGAFAILVASVFRLLSLAGFTISPVLLFAMITTAIEYFHNNLNFLVILISVTLCFVLVLGVIVYSFILWVASNEMMQEKDKGFVLSVFSGIVALAALIVSYLQFVKGV